MSSIKLKALPLHGSISEHGVRNEGAGNLLMSTTWLSVNAGLLISGLAKSKQCLKRRKHGGLCMRAACLGQVIALI